MPLAHLSPLLRQTPLARHRLLSASLACFWTFHFIVLWSSAFSIGNPHGNLDLGNDLTWLIAIVCNALALAACALYLKRHDSMPFENTALIAGVITAVGIGLIALRVAHQSLALDIAYIAGTASFGIGTGLLMASYADRLRLVTPQTTFMATAGAFFLGALLCLLISTAFVPAAAWTVTALLPLAAAVLYRKDILQQECEKREGPRRSLESPAELPIKSLLCLIAIIGLTAGIMRGSSHGSAAPPPDFLFDGSVLIGGALLLVLSFFVNRLKPTLLLQVVVVIISAAFMVGALLAGPATPAAFVIHTLGFLFFVAFVWLFCTFLSNGRPRGTSLFILGLLANQAGQALGSLGFFGLLSVFGAEGTAALPLSLGTLYLLLIAALVFFANAGRSKRAVVAASTLDALELLRRLAEARHLTTREVEIGALVADGLSRADIAERLTVSQETVKTHTKHLYQKLDVHSRGELVSLLRAEADRAVGDSLLL